MMAVDSDVEKAVVKENGVKDKQDGNILSEFISREQPQDTRDVAGESRVPLIDIAAVQPPLAEPEYDDTDAEVDNIARLPEGHTEIDEIDGVHHDGDIGIRINGRAMELSDDHGKGEDHVDYGESLVEEHSMSVLQSQFQLQRAHAREFDIPSRPMSPALTATPDVNVYQQKKNLAQGMMDLALLTANANQFRYVMDSSSEHAYYWVSLVFISLSIVLQILVGIGLILNSRYDVKHHDDICKADKVNNYTVIGIFLITVVNVFVSAFYATPAARR